MTTSTASAASTDVHATERRLAALLDGVRLVCELDLEGGDYAAARASMEALVGRGYSHRLGRLYPATTVFYLVAEGVHRYNGGSYWPQLSVRGIDPGLMGPAFVDALEQLDLPVYEDETEQGLRYVSKILLHGGLPRYCAADVLRRLVEKLREGITDARDLVNSWRRTRSHLIGLDAPAQRFLLHGGDEAVDMIDRIVDLVRAGATDERVDAERLGLPRYLVEEYLGLDRSDRRLARRARPPRPSVVLDPLTGEGPEPVLPVVPSTSTWSRWHLATASSLLGRDPAIAASTVRVQEVPLPPPGPWRVSLDGPGGRTSFEFRGIDRAPVWFFDGRSGVLLREQDRLRGDSVLAVAPGGMRFTNDSVDGEPIPSLAELPPLTGLWSRHEVRLLDLRGVGRIHVSSGSIEIGFPGTSATVAVAGATPRPRLEGTTVPGVQGPDGEEVFSDWPFIVVPAALHAHGHRLRFRAVVNGGDEIIGVLSDLAGSEAGWSLDQLSLGRCRGGGARRHRAARLRSSGREVRRRPRRATDPPDARADAPRRHGAAIRRRRRCRARRPGRRRSASHPGESR